MKVKITSLLYILSLMSLTAFGQKYTSPPNMPEFDLRKWKFGFTLGTEFQNFNITNNGYNAYQSEIPQLVPGFHVGIITNRRLNEHLNLRIIPSLSLGFRTVETTGVTDSTKIKSTYMSLPVLIKYKAVRINNWRPYMIAGTNLKYDLATDTDALIALKHIDAVIELGLGSDFYMESFRLGIELRFGIGLLNVLNTDIDEPDIITSSIDKIKTKTFTISINFE